MAHSLVDVPCKRGADLHSDFVVVLTKRQIHDRFVYQRVELHIAPGVPAFLAKLTSGGKSHHREEAGADEGFAVITDTFECCATTNLDCFLDFVQVVTVTHLRELFLEFRTE